MPEPEPVPEPGLWTLREKFFNPCYCVVMSKLMRDPQLDQLVQQLNRTEASIEAGDQPAGERAASAQTSWPPASVPEGNPLEALLIEMAQRGASDLILLVGSPPIFRVGGRLQPANSATLEASTVQGILGGFVTSKMRERIESAGCADFSIRLSKPDEGGSAWRFRVNVHRQRGTMAAAIRALPVEIPSLGQLNLPPSLAELVKPTRGLVLVCGPTGSGKSTTLAGMVGEINKTQGRHVITIEDPLEYEHRNVKSIIEHVEVGRDTPSFAAALRAALRQDPDVILVGEMRDLETVATALTAAETGHLILSTLHTSDATQAIHRIVDVFPPAQQTQIRQQLALSLNAVVCQQLIPRSNGAGRAVAVEVLLANTPVRNHIRNDKLQNLATEITLGRRQGMISLEDSLARLIEQGLISLDEARVRATRPDELNSLLRL